MMKFGVISSSNGGAFKAFYRVAGLHSEQVVMVTDRPCGIEDFAAAESIGFTRIESSDNDEFSKSAKTYIDQQGGVDVIFLFYTRLITQSLFNHYLTINFHPSLLPAFKGFSPTKKALKAGVKYFGTTAHAINEKADDGEIIGQSCIPVKNDHTIEALERASFIQKAYQMCLIKEMLEEGALEFNDGLLNQKGNWPVSLLFNPALKSGEMIDQLMSLDQTNQAGVFNELQ